MISADDNEAIGGRLQGPKVFVERRQCGGRSGDSSCNVKTQVVGCEVHVVGFGQKGPKRRQKEEQR